MSRYVTWASGRDHVLSGYLISTVILEQLRRSTFTLADFYVRRARRLFPALAIVLATCLLLGWFVLLPDELQGLGKHIGAAAAFILNFAVWREGSYFDPVATLNPVLHLWSLGIEEQFYLVWPLVLDEGSGLFGVIDKEIRVSSSDQPAVR